MASFKIKGGKRLSGSIIPQGAKNEALQVLCAVLLTDSKVVINNLPDIIARLYFSYILRQIIIFA